MKTTCKIVNTAGLLVVFLLLISCHRNEITPVDNSVPIKLLDVPDYVLYLSNRKGGPIRKAMNELYFVDVATGEELQLTNTTEYNNVVKVVYHLDTRKVYFTSIIYADNNLAGLDIYSLDLGTLEITNLTNTLEKIDMGIYDPVDFPWHTDPEISPDGTRIAYVRMGPDRWDIMVYNLESQKEDTLVTTGSSNFAWKPRWSPDGTKILYMAKQSTNWRVLLMNADGSDKKNISGQPYSEGPVWCPDGKSFLFLAGQGGSTFKLDLYTADANGDNVNELTSGGITSNAAWSHSGKFIAYRSGNLDAGIGDIHIISKDGTDDQVITDLNADITDIRWSYGDDKLSFTYSGSGVPEVYEVNLESLEVQRITFAGYSSKAHWIDVNLLQ